MRIQMVSPWIAANKLAESGVLIFTLFYVYKKRCFKRKDYH